MENKTNFEEIRRVALKLSEMEGTPELTKDFLVRMVASESSVVNFMQGFAVMYIACPAFQTVVDKSMTTAMTNYLTFLLDRRE